MMLLQQVTDWPQRAADAQWSVKALAAACGVSLGQLERHFYTTCTQCPLIWLKTERMRCAGEMLERHVRIKDIAANLCYGHPRNFTRAFSEHFGYSPREHLKLRTPNSELDSVVKRRRGKQIRTEK